jgi:hypothetical protein
MEISMLRILGRSTSACDGISRRDALRVGGLGIAGITMADALQAASQTGGNPPRKAKSVILLNLFGGPPHMDMFDMKPAAPANVRGEFSPVSTSVPSLQICELMPQIARRMDRCTLIRTYSHKYNSHNPYNVLTGYDGGKDRENYFAKPTDHPSIGSVCLSRGMGRRDVPPYVVMPAYPGFSQSLRRAGPYGGYLGKRYDPLITVCTPEFPKKEKGKFYEPVTPTGEPRLPALDGLPDVTADRLDRRQTLLQQLDRRVAELDANRAVDGMSHFQKQVFELLTSAKTRSAFDLSKEPAAVRDRYGRNLWGNSLLTARRLVEAGSLFVTVNWEEANSGGHWDMHNKVFGMLRVHLPVLDRMVSALLDDLEQRGRLNETLVIVMGEMGRTPKVNRAAGRDHWPQCGFALLAGGGTKRGCVLGKTDKQAAYPTDRPVSAGDLAATIYQLLGVDPTLHVHDRLGRPIGIAHGGAPVFEVIA